MKNESPTASEVPVESGDLLVCHDCGWRGEPEDSTWTDIERNETDGESPGDQRSCPECLSINLAD
jgi:hypothetical protein